MNMVVLNPYTGDIILNRAYDTFGSSVEFEKALKTIMDGEIIVVAVNNEASTRLSANAKEFFQNMGSTQIENLRQKNSWSFIGTKG